MQRYLEENSEEIGSEVEAVKEEDAEAQPAADESPTVVRANRMLKEAQELMERHKAKRSSKVHEG